MTTTTQAHPDLAHHRIAHTTAAVVLIRDEKVFLKRQGKDAAVYPSMWDLPHVEVPGGNAPEDVVVPGLREELGIEIESFHLLSAQDDLVGEVCWRRFVYRVTAFRGDVNPPETHRWYSEKEFADVFQLNPLVTALPLF